MASSSSALSVVPSIAFLVAEKLNRSNHQLWKAQVMSALRGAQKAHFIAADVAAPAKTIKDKDSKDVPNPEYDLWVAQDQQVLNYLLSSVSRDILAQIATLLTSVKAWDVIESMFASQSRARVINTRMSLATAQK
jgi:hypothetical protein